MHLQTKSLLKCSIEGGVQYTDTMPKGAVPVYPKIGYGASGPGVFITLYFHCNSGKLVSDIHG